MRYNVILAVLLSVARAAPLLTSGSSFNPHKYIVMFKDSYTHDTFMPHFNEIAQRYSTVGPAPEVHHKFENLPGFVAMIQNQDALRDLLNRPEVKYIERDGIVTTMTIQDKPPSWVYPASPRENST
ncbi:hypothetical protein BGZ83_000264 [Gryganskiella cystojenkinii]|nr:hypothetical protein BGZ83_000264 [Gryganskiella cystojenkinii]